VTYGERERIESIAYRCAQLGVHDVRADGNAIVREIVDELNRNGARLPESTCLVLRRAAARVLMSLEEPPK
jgi:hypothetical protein